jgi:hypothetical protein
VVVDLKIGSTVSEEHTASILRTKIVNHHHDGGSMHLLNVGDFSTRQHNAFFIIGAVNT